MATWQSRLKSHYEENIITRAVQRKLGNLSIWLCSPEDLVIQKAVANRGKDWQDIEGVLARQGKRLDFAYIENWLEEFADALEEPGILEKYHETRDRVRAILTERKKR